MSVNYIDNNKFQQFLKEYLKEVKDSKDKSSIPDVIIVYFYKIVNNLLHKKEFMFYDYDTKEDMKSNAIFYMIKYIDKYNYKEYSNPFSYFTQIAYNSFIQIINKENIEREKKFLLQGIENEYKKEENKNKNKNKKEKK